MVSDKLIGETYYVTWANAMRILLVARRKLPFINGKIQRPSDQSSKDYDNWEIVNGLVMAWIINSVAPHIASTLMRAQTAHQAWIDLEDRYKQENAPQTNEVKYRLSTL